ncbi:hypothetical protein JTB14_027096 [Gonioctena quinquepunctata]|nr:hypothetical protein JTB14_027096 [Gonioctena quinquepunctata]
MYCTSNEIFQKFIAPNYSATNGLAERNIQKLKNLLKAVNNVKKSIHDKLRNTLFHYRATPLTFGVLSDDAWHNRFIEVNTAYGVFGNNQKMKFFIIISIVVIATDALRDGSDWKNFKLKYSRNYQNLVEEKQRFEIFNSNLLRIKEHNEKYENGLSSYKMGVNRFADLTLEEFKERLTFSKGSKPTISAKQTVIDYEGDIPKEIDWLKKGAVTPVKDQAACGSCWSFSATGTLEGFNFIKTGKLVSLSEQQLVDCAEDNCFGCDGGLMYKALEYVVANGIMPENDYPYEAYNDECRLNKSDIAKAVALKGPISVAIDAEGFQLYESGIFDYPSCDNSIDDMDHGVLVTGYGSLNGADYWIVKNSWGTDWGMDGYVWMSRNKRNQCGIATQASYPVNSTYIAFGNNLKMKFLVIMSIVVITTNALSDGLHWENFKLKYSRNYQNLAEEKQRLAIFKSNLLKIKEHNEKYEKGLSSYKMGVNQFADLTSEEFKERLMYSRGSVPTIPTNQTVIDYEGDLPEEFDWVKKGAVTPVETQGACGSCWAFSTTGTLEGLNFIKTGKLVSFSKQQLIDCVTELCFGCHGGIMYKALEYVVGSGIMLEEHYPYEALNDECRFNKTDIALRIKSYEYVKANDENELKKAVALKGPISISINADPFHHYESGILDFPTCFNQVVYNNHGVLLTGYGSLNGQDYWI